MYRLYAEMWNSICNSWILQKKLFGLGRQQVLSGAKSQMTTIDQLILFKSYLQVTIYWTTWLNKRTKAKHAKSIINGINLHFVCICCRDARHIYIRLIWAFNCFLRLFVSMYLVLFTSKILLDTQSNQLMHNCLLMEQRILSIRNVWDNYCLHDDYFIDSNTNTLILITKQRKNIYPYSTEILRNVHLCSSDVFMRGLSFLSYAKIQSMLTLPKSNWHKFTTNQLIK